MSPVNRIFDDTFRSAWRRFVRLWRPMATWTIFVWLFVGLLLGPFLSGALSRVVLRGDRILIGNEELLAWLLTAEGIAYVSLAGTLLLMGGVVRYAGLFRIVTDDLSGKKPSLGATVAALLLDAPALFRLCLAAVVAGLILLLPLIGGIGIVYLVFLSEHDINYYLFTRPREWQLALWAAGILGVPWALGAAYLVLRALPIVPAFLDGHRPARVALRRARGRSRGGTVRLLRLLLLCVGTWWLVRALAQWSLFFVAATGIEILSGWVASIPPILLATGAYTVAALAIDTVLSFFGFSFAAIILTKFYYEDTDLHAMAPAADFGLHRIPGDTLAFLRRWLRPARALPVIAVLLLLSGSISGWLLHQVPRHTDFLVIAHRAGAFLATENTIAALERSIEAGADYAEIDVQQTRDGKVVVVHDADLMRLAGDSRRIAQTNFAGIRDVVQGFDADVPPESRRVATLEEFLDRARGRIRLNIELKYYGWDPSLAGKVVERVRRYEMEDEVVLMSLDLRAVRQVREVAPDISVGYVAAVSIGDLRGLPVDFLAVHQRLATPRMIRAANREGMEVYVWTLNRGDTILDAARRGVDGIITDDPVLALRIREELSGLTAVERILLTFRNVMFEGDPADSGS